MASIISSSGGMGSNNELHMTESQREFIDIDQLRTGMFIELEVGWMAHPFPTGSFKISSEKQIEVIRKLGIKRVRYIPGQSDLTEAPSMGEALSPTPIDEASRDAALELTSARERALLFQQKNRGLLAAQTQSMAACERRFGEAIRQYRVGVEQVNSKPRLVSDQCHSLINSFVGEMIEGESSIRLLSEGAGEMAFMHPVNVTVISLLLGKSFGLPREDLVDLGVAAFLHDIGKFALPYRFRWQDESFSTAEYKLYQEHVSHSVTLGKRMELTAPSLQAIAQHHEMMDGSGFPDKLAGESLSLASKILALVNRYDNLCNPIRPITSITPHEALSLIYSQLKSRFDKVVLGAFIHMIGVYPPGSIVQLTDGRFAIVVSVNSSRPLKPRIVVYDAEVPKDDALILDLEQSSGIGIRRSLKPVGLPKAAIDYLAPRLRLRYFFEKMGESALADESAMIRPA